MVITFKRLMFKTYKYLPIYQDREKIGEMQYWQSSNMHHPKFDVNIGIKGLSDQSYEIEQQSFSMLNETRWAIYENSYFIADMHNGNMTEMDHVNVQLNDGRTLFIKAVFRFKTSVHLYIDDELAGEASTTGWFFNVFHNIQLYDDKSVEPLLLAGIMYAFFLFSNAS